MTHKLRATVWAASLVWMGSVRPALGCSTCYGNAEGPMIDAARLGTFLLLGVVLCVQIAFAVFFLYLRRRAARLSRNAGGLQWSGGGPGPHGEWRNA